MKKRLLVLLTVLLVLAAMRLAGTCLRFLNF